MDIKVNRQKGTKEWTLSSFLSVCNTVKGVGVEDEFRAIKVKGETRVPAGTYGLTLTHSPKFSAEYFRDDQGNLILAKDRITVELKQKYAWEHELITIGPIPNFDRILLHWGNDDLDTDGCYLVGCVFGKSKRGRDGVVNSRKKYTEIYPLIWRAIHKEKCTIQYIDHE